MAALYGEDEDDDALAMRVLRPPLAPKRTARRPLSSSSGGVQCGRSAWSDCWRESPLPLPLRSGQEDTWAGSGVGS